MLNISFLFIALGAFLAIIRRCIFLKWRIKALELITALIIIGVALASWFDIFIGPIGDARRYHTTINSCIGGVPPCGEKLHEILWGLTSSFLGPGWGIIYGFLLTNILILIISSRVVTFRTPVTLLLFLYSAYQIGNGMAEGTFFLLLFFGIIALKKTRFNLGAGALIATCIAHLGNAPFIFYLLKYPRGWLVILLTFSLFSLGMLAIYGENLDIYSLVNKAGALASQEATLEAIETKANVSVRDADTSYAHILFEMNFPLNFDAILYAVILYIAPVLAGGNIITLCLSVLSSIMTCSTLWLARRDLILIIIFFLSTIVFGLASFTPGIGLRHKVPLFLFTLVLYKNKVVDNFTYRHRF